MAMTPDIFTEKLKEACGGNLRSVVLYGSAAAGDHAGKKSDYNVLVVLQRMGVSEMSALMDISARWAAEGNPAPLLFTWERLQRSGDVFPIELADIKENHKILHGADPLSEVPINIDNLRIELEHELKGKLMHLRERFLLTRGKPAKVEELLVVSLSTFLVLFRAALRLHGEKPPAAKMEALGLLRRYVEFDDEVFRLVGRMKEGTKAPAEPLALFERYLKAVETVVDAVDGWEQPIRRTMPC